MKHFTLPFWKGTEVPIPSMDELLDGLARLGKMAGLPERAATRGISYPLTADFVRSFAMSGHPFLTYYEFNDLTGWCRDNQFAPEHVKDYSNEIGQSYTVWTHESVCTYRRHIFLDSMPDEIRISFEIPTLEKASWFPLRITLFDRDGIYFQNDQKLVVDRLTDSGPVLTAWKKIPGLRTSLPQLHRQTRQRG